jgi:superoxide dismutase, Cu-Zn family
MVSSRFHVTPLAVVVIPALLGLLSPASAQTHSVPEHSGLVPVKKGIAVLQPTKGSAVRGTVTYEVVEGGVHVVANVGGLTPGKHGFHIHEFGDCSADDGSSAGGHFNPGGTSHGAPASDPRHAGDMGNIEADKDGHATLDYRDQTMTLSGPQSIIGHAVIVHEKEDDLKSQPTGNAGARVACGVIGVAKAK